ncbi:MAG TPA: hypothetical protein DHU96_19750 [Actinobacteria bacterium]|nr:hypothetical protein [Actinomycetota bacterium]
MNSTGVTGTGIGEAIAAERRQLADLLAGLPPASWDAASLCAGWRVREVVAHMTMPFRYSGARFMIEMMKARGNFNRMADRSARRDAALPAEVLVASLRDNEQTPWKPPGGGLEGALTHDVIHGLDITVPLGTGRNVPEQHLRIVLDAITQPRSRKFFGADLAGIQFRAGDLDWSFGSGTPVTGQAQHLALALCGRRLPAGLLSGEQSARFSQP